MVENKDNKDLNSLLDEYLKKEPIVNKLDDNLNSDSKVAVIKNDNSIQERINKKIITEDGRQLLI